MEKMDRLMQQRMHFYRALAELKCILEYYTPEEDHEFMYMEHLIQQLETDVLEHSSLA